ncbi:hypothetical protein AYO20_11705 [Fonsecaea nubica]|uniref:FAD dependent oxidoreductase domain-containing protein n=1 Tax=Fonsecaea nubica TaxID=856822 RepID=A0A178BQQ9_9EURO|nr:hypothetical protein AYO20_11705 [Fonsecaea nubica]OAL18771.1 hypothetical protein AYO20_11705 [Fonsecaea nubica]
MVTPSNTKTWLKTPVGSNLLAQISADPGLPQPKPTVSSWQLPPHPEVAKIHSKELPRVTDYLIIGSGIAGCGVAKTLLEHPSSGSAIVTVLDARGLCSGATGRNGGQLVKPYALRFAQVAESFGVEMATKVARMALHTLEEMHKLANSYDEDLKKEANARRVTKRIVYMDEASWNRVLGAVDLYETHLPEEKGSFRYVPKEQVESEWNVKGGFGGYQFPAGVCWPYRLVTGVFKRLCDLYPGRINIETHTPATTILYDAETDPKYPYTVVTPRGVIRAATLVHCNNGHVGHLLPRMRGKIWPIRGTTSAQNAGPMFPDLSNKCSWTFLSDMHYDKATRTILMGWWYGLQNPPNGDIWIGGDHKRIEDVFTADDSTIGDYNRETITNILPTVFNRKWVPEKPKINGVWTGVMAQTADTLPFVGKLPDSITGRPGGKEWIAAGWNSYGMTNGLTSGEAVAKMILGEAPPSWFPEAYLPTEKRLGGSLMAPEAATLRFLEQSGIGSTLETSEAPRSKL